MAAAANPNSGQPPISAIPSEGTIIPRKHVQHVLLNAARKSPSSPLPALTSDQPSVTAAQSELIINNPAATTRNSAGNQGPPPLCAACTCGMNGCRFHDIPRFITVQRTSGSNRPLLNQVSANRILLACSRPDRSR